MADGGYLVPPSQDPSKEEIWVETRKRLGRFLPDLFAEVFPDPPVDNEKSQPETAVSSPAQANEPEQKSEETVPAQDNVEKKEDPVVDGEAQPAPEGEESAS